ncbi:hypothetical protein [Sphingomonas sp. NPDC079357]|jgi:hypothetical protein
MNDIRMSSAPGRPCGQFVNVARFKRENAAVRSSCRSIDRVSLDEHVGP